MPYKILLAESQPVVQLGVRSAFVQEPDFEIVSTVTKAEQLVQSVLDIQPNLLITEVRIGGVDVLKKLEQAMSQCKDMVVIVFSDNQESFNVARAGALGCYEYIAKSLPCEALVTASKNGVNGLPASPDGMLHKVKSRLKAARPHLVPQPVLTPREMQVIRHIAMGMKNREIGLSLEISVETVKEHVQNILRKLQVNDRTQAAIKAHKSGWV